MVPHTIPTVFKLKAIAQKCFSQHKILRDLYLIFSKGNRALAFILCYVVFILHVSHIRNYRHKCVKLTDLCFSF